MKIHFLGHPIAKYIDETIRIPWKDGSERVRTSGNTLSEERENPPENPSEAVEPFHRVERVIGCYPDIRSNKLRAIREAIERGEYRIDYDRIAENMLGVFKEEMSVHSSAPPRAFPARCLCRLS